MNNKSQAPTSGDHQQIMMKVSPLSTSNHRDHNLNLNQEQDDQDQSPPLSPIRMPQLSSSSSSIASWSSSSAFSSSSSEEGECNSNGMSKEDRATYNTKFARYHLETYRQNDRMRWNFDFDHNRPLDDHHHSSGARYQWEPAPI